MQCLAIIILQTAQKNIQSATFSRKSRSFLLCKQNTNNNWEPFSASCDSFSLCATDIVVHRDTIAHTHIWFQDDSLTLFNIPNSGPHTYKALYIKVIETWLITNKFDEPILLLTDLSKFFDIYIRQRYGGSNHTTPTSTQKPKTD